MGEQSKLPQEDMKNGLTNGQNENPDEIMDEDSDEDEMTEEEFKALDNQLNALNTALDDVEQKNDNIFAELQLLLQSNREIRNQLLEHTKKT